MARLSVTWGNPRLSVSYPAVLAALSKLLGGHLSATGALTPGLRQDHLFAGEIEATGGLAAFLSTVEFALDAEFSATGGLAASLTQDHGFAADLAATGALTGSLEQEHGLGTVTLGTLTLLNANLFVGNELAADLAGTGALAGDIEVTFEIGVDLAATGALDADLDVQTQADLAADIAATGALDVDLDVQVPVDLAADLAATGGLTADLDVQASAGDPAFRAVAVAYAGNGSTQSITGVGFTPEAVLILQNNTSSGAERVITAASWNDNYWRLGISNSPAFWTDAITSFDADGFSLGSRSNVNGNNTNYIAICFAPGSGTETANFDALTWANSFSAKVISHGLGTAPIWAWNNQDDSTAGAEWLDDGGLDTHSVNVGDTIGSASGSVTAVSASDITVGTQTEWNGDFSGTSYMVLFGGAGSSGKYATGTYTGDGSSGNAITGLGFAPSVVMIRSVDGAGASVLTDDLSSNTAFDLRDGSRDSAFTLDSDGFTVNGNDKINRSGETFRYFAWV